MTGDRQKVFQVVPIKHHTLCTFDPAICNLAAPHQPHFVRRCELADAPKLLAETMSLKTVTTSAASSHLLRSSAAFRQRTVLFWTIATALALMLGAILYYGFGAVVSCELQSYGSQQQARGLAVELASINACGL